MGAKHYSIQILNRGEEMSYVDADITLLLERTYCSGHRLFCDNTSGATGPALPFDKRREVILNLCDFFDTKDHPIIFVIDERDKDRHQLEALFADLVSHGHQISVESDSAERRERVLDEMNLSIINAGTTLTLDGTKIRSADEYWRWKQNARRAAGPTRLGE